MSALVEVTELRSSELDFAVVDIETTGFSPRLHDRLIEIAIIRLSSRGEVQDEYVTLVNPQRDVGPTYIHGITAGEVVDAPVFSEIIGDVVTRLDESVFVAHNARFDREFISSEMTMAGVMLPEIPSLCTLQLAYRLYPNLANHKLATCCAAAGLPHEASHSALEDARAAAELLVAYLSAARQKGWSSLADLGCKPLSFPSEVWPHLPSGGRCCLRGAPGRKSDEGHFLARVVASLGSVSAVGERLAPYMDLLDRVLEDRRVTQEEGLALREIAHQWGLTREDAMAAHNAYLEALIVSALGDGQISGSERRDLEAVTQLLALDVSVLDALVDEIHESTSPDNPSPLELNAESLEGKTVCFTGTLNARLENQPITREVACELAAEAGLQVVDRVTKSLDILVVADRDTQSSKATKAQRYGTRIMAEAAFWKAIGVQTE